MGKKGIPRLNRHQLENLLNEQPFYQRNPEIADGIRARASEHRKPLTERSGQSSLDRRSTYAQSLVNIDGKMFHCRITRIAGKGAKIYDDDNFSGGLKQCRDAIAAQIGLKGDDEKDGITFSYYQEMDLSTTQSKMRIEIYVE